MNTALEAQEVEISMSLKGTVSTRTPVVLIANPLKSDNAKFDPFDPHRSIIQQAGFKESTMTRMDLAYFPFDEKNSAEEAEAPFSLYLCEDGWRCPTEFE